MTALPRSYASATAAWAPSDPQPLPDPAYSELSQPANEHLLNEDQKAFYRGSRVSPPGSPKSRTGGEGEEHEGIGSPPPRYETEKDRKDLDGELAGKDSDKPGAPFKTILKGHGAMERNPVHEGLQKRLAEPYMPRANIAASVEAPFGTQAGGWAEKHEDESVLQQHVAFFDKDGDGVIYPWDTFKGFHELGYSLFWCVLAVFIINPAFALFTAESLWMALWWGVSVKNIHRAKHGSDTGVYDPEGRFIPAKFEAMFAAHDTENKGGLTFLQGLKMLHRNRNILDPIGWTGEFFELLATYLLIWPSDGVIRKEDWRTVYDGSIFFSIAEREKNRRQKHPLGAWVDLIPLSGWWKENRAAPEPKLDRETGRPVRAKKSA